MNLTVSHQNRIIFSHDGHWLHPLFALEDFLNDSEYDPAELYLKDKLIGRAAAVLIHRMGFKNCHGNIISSRAVKFFEEQNIKFTYVELVKRLECQTELILTDDVSPDEAYAELCRRAGRSI